MKKTLTLLLLLCSAAVWAQPARKSITLEDIWKHNTFRIKSVPGFNGMKDGKRYTQIDKEGGRLTIAVYSLDKGKKEKILFDNAVHSFEGEKIAVEDYAFSEDENKMLLFTGGEHIYRRSVLYHVYVFDVKTGALQQLDTQKVLHARFSPDGGRVAFVKDNNLYYRDLASGRTVAVTNDGKWNAIINGNCDWVYEEEFEFTRAFEWSPDGRYLAFYRFDETAVPEFTMDMYGPLYPKRYTFKYPKAGEPNSVVQIRCHNLASGETVRMDVGSETDQYIPRIKWSNDPSQLCIFRLNRLQNQLDLLLSDARTGSSQVIYQEQNPYYIEINDDLTFLPDNSSFIFSSEQSGYTHLYRWNWKEKKLTQLTKGDFDIAGIAGVDQKKKLVYYTAAEPTPLQRKLYVTDWEGGAPKCLTPEDGTHQITPVAGFRYFLDKYSTLNSVPVFYLRDANGKIVRTLEDNRELAQTLKNYNLGETRLLQLPGDSGVLLNAWMITPPDFDPGKKYPVLMFQYSGPGSQQVADRFPLHDYSWHQMLAEKGYIIVCADGTGTGFRGQAFKKKTYLQLGKYESDDQIAVARHLGTLPYVDASRIGIWGWSYGGFMSATCILKGNDVFKAAIAVAPVTNWRYYDNIYTERYMRRPQENQAGYDQNAPEQMADRLKGKLLVIHGTADDNVHFQNAVMLVDALIRNNKDFDSEFYPNKTHGIGGGVTRLQLYRRMTQFILDNL
jgi:dipeptidyl-peptidase-4